MAQHYIRIFNPENFSDLPIEDGTQRSALEIGDSITFLGGGEDALIQVDDPTDGVFSEVQTDQTLATGLSFDGVSYSAGQQVTPSYIIEFSGSDGETYTLVSLLFSVNTSLEQPDAAYFLGMAPPPGTVLTVVSEENPAYGTSPPYPPICFEGATRLETRAGPRPVRDLRAGDLVRILDGSFVPIRWISQHTLSAGDCDDDPSLRPVCIPAGALGPGLPERRLRLSRNHRLLIASPIVRRMFDADAVLAPVSGMIGHNGIAFEPVLDSVCYVHVLLDRHDVMLANGAPAESLFLGNEARKMIGSPGRRAIYAICPDLKRQTPAPRFPLISRSRTRQTVLRSKVNDKALWDPGGAVQWPPSQAAPAQFADGRPDGAPHYCGIGVRSLA